MSRVASHTRETKETTVHVTLDLDGFRSGSMNAGLPLVELQAVRPPDRGT